MSLSKKISIIILTLLLVSLAGGFLFIKSMGIDPLLWISMPTSSKFDDNTLNDAISVSMETIPGEFDQVTDFQFLPGSDSQSLVLQKTGELYLLDLDKKDKQLLFKLNVLTESEQGLLGVAIHPEFPELPCIYLNTVVRKNNKDMSQVTEWCTSSGVDSTSWYQNKLIFELAQPYKNHNAGHLIFDQKGLLYIPWGDGGSGGDPQNYALNLQSYLGKVLRINPEASNPDLPYSIPQENPFIVDESIPDEIYAYGLRNPWKLAFDDQWRLIAADVGQNLWEEITFIEAGGDHGWNQIEALHCFKEVCSAENTVLPFIEYGHDVGRSVTGGYQYMSKEIPRLYKKYIYGDFVSGRIWAADLPESSFEAKLNESEEAKTYTKVYQLGQWPLLISSFARDHSGNIYVADFARGKIHKIVNSTNEKATQ